MFIHVYTCLYMLIPLMVITCDNWGMVYCCFTYVRKKTWKKHVRYIISPNGDSQANLGIGRNMQETRGDSKPLHFEYLGGIVPK